jgi:hypothetical protein
LIVFKKKSKALRVVFFNSFGVVIKDLDISKIKKSNEWTQIIPGTIASALFEEVCQIKKIKNNKL